MGWLRTSVASGAPSAISGAPHGRHRDSSRRGRGLRAGLAALALILLAPAGAVAADMPKFLRGSFTPSSSRWDGVFFGAQFGVANMDTDFGNEASQWVGYSLRNSTLESPPPVGPVASVGQPSSWPLTPSNISHGQSYGAFLGYNFQWDQLVLGFDMAYNRMSSMTSSSASGLISRTVTTSDGVYNVSISGQASLKLIDYATLRGRAGYAFGQFLPYAVIGAAVGRFNYTTSANLQVCGFDFPGTNCSTNNYFIPTPLSDSKNNAIAAGLVAGLGMDVALLPNVFLRGEWEFVAFAPISGIRANLNTGRVGIGVKF